MLEILLLISPNVEKHSTKLVNVHFGTYVFPKSFTSVYFLILCSPSVADPGFPKVCANLSFCKIIAENYTRIKEFRLGACVPSAPSWIRHCLTACTLWHRISFCRSAIGLPPAGQKLNNRIFSKLFGALFYEAFLQATRVVGVFIKSWKPPFAISFIEC